MAANNETGVLQPWAEVHDLCLTHKVPSCDAAQWIGNHCIKGLGEAILLVVAAVPNLAAPKVLAFECPSQPWCVLSSLAVHKRKVDAQARRMSPAFFPAMAALKNARRFG